MRIIPRNDASTQFVDSYFIVPSTYAAVMRRWWVVIEGKQRSRSVTAPDQDAARQKAIDFYQVEPAVLLVVEIKANNTKPNPRDQLDDLWHRRPASLL